MMLTSRLLPLYLLNVAVVVGVGVAVGADSLDLLVVPHAVRARAAIMVKIICRFTP